MGQYVDFYCENENKELKKIVNPILAVKFGWIPQQEYDDFYSIASMVVWDCEKRFDSKKVKTKKFKSFVSGCIHNKIKTHVTYMNRDKRKMKDNEGNPIHTASLDAPTREDDLSTIGDYLSDDSNNTDFYEMQSIREYLDTLSPTQKKIVKLKLNGLNEEEVKKVLKFDDKKYERCYSQLKSLDNKLKIKKIFGEETVTNQEEDKPMVTTQTAEKSKPMQYSIDSINKKIEKRTIRFDHPLQRESDQWSPAMKGNLISDILQGNPLPEIVFAEQIINGIPVIWDLDGKQRCTNCYSYTKDEFKVSKNIRRWEISYISQISDDNGNPVLDENGFPISEYKTFDIRNKKFSQLPKELQEKFLDYTFKCDQYLNCDSEEIAYHIIRYNEGKSMTKAQKGITRIGEEFATMVKSISSMPFFREIGGYKLSEAKNGTLERVVVESVMASKYLDDWRKEQENICEYLKDNATTEDFDDFEDLVTRLETVVTDDVADMFDSKDSFLWFGLFARFVNKGESDEKFVEFMTEFARSLHIKNVNGTSFDELCIDPNTGNTRGTKDKNMVLAKMELLETLMNEFLHIDKADLEEVNTLDFVRENVKADATEEDVNFYSDMLDDYTLEVDNNTKLLDQHNRPSLVALVGYACENECDEQLTDFIKQWFAINTMYILNQQKNYETMLKSFQKGQVA